MYIPSIKTNKISGEKKTGSTTKRVEEQKSSDEIQIIREIQSTPKKKCVGSLREFFKSPPKTSSPLNVSSPTLSIQRGQESPEIRDFSSSVSETRSVALPSSSESLSGRSTRNTLVLSPVQTSSPVTRGTPSKNFQSAAKSLFNSQPDEVPNNGSSDLFGAADDEDFDDFENDENLEKMIQSFTQVPKDEDSENNKSKKFSTSSPEREPSINLKFSPSSPSTPSRLSHPNPSRRTREKADNLNKNIILDRVLKTEDNVYIEQEVSRLYTVQDENTNSVNTTSVSKLDRLLEQSYKRNRTPKKKEEPPLNDSMADLLDDLSRSPVRDVPANSVISARTSICDKIESPPNQIPDM